MSQVVMLDVPSNVASIFSGTLRFFHIGAVLTKGFLTCCATAFLGRYVSLSTCLGGPYILSSEAVKKACRASLRKCYESIPSKRIQRATAFFWFSFRKHNPEGASL